MNLIFQYTPENLQEAYSLHYKKNSPLQGRIMLFFGVLLIWTGLLLILISRNEGRQFLNYSFIVYGIVVIIIHKWMMGTLGKRTFKKLKDFHEPIAISISEEGIAMKVTKGESKVRWESIQRAVVSDSMVLLYTSKTSFYIFPMKNFNKGEFVPFVELVKQKVTVIK